MPDDRPADPGPQCECCGRPLAPSGPVEVDPELVRATVERMARHAFLPPGWLDWARDEDLRALVDIAILEMDLRRRSWQAFDELLAEAER